MNVKWSDSVWFGCFLASYLFFYARKIILARHRYNFELFDFDFRDGRNLASIARSEDNIARRRIYHSVNWGFRLLFFVGAVLMFLMRVPFRKFFTILTGG